MKRIILSLCLLLSTSNLWAAGEFDNTLNTNEFSELNKIESFVNKNPETTLGDLKAQDSELLKNVAIVEDTNSIASNVDRGGMPLIGAFWWGCCLGIIGLALVYFMTDKDRDQMRPAFWGCIISTLLVGVGGLINPFGW
jgi:hypothetical protein